MRLVLIAVLLLLGHRAMAEDILIECSPARPAGITEQTGSRFMLRSSVARHLSESAPALKLESVRQTAMAVPTIEVLAFRPEGIASAAEWRATWFEAVLHPAGRPIVAEALLRGTVRPPAPGDDRTALVAEFPDLDGGWLPSRWDVYVLACVDKGHDAATGRENSREVRAFARQPLYVSSLKLSAATGIAAALGLYLLLALAAMRTQRRQFAFARGRAAADGRRLSPFGFALKPTTIMQDAFGHCSLARFQVLLFTLVLTGIYAYVLMRIGTLPNLSASVLGLLGITLTGSVLGRVADGPVLETPNRVWLLGTGVLDPTPRLPEWTDLIAGDGEIDVTRVQALAFTLFAAAALVAKGTGDLASFEIPDQLNYLMGISQAVYVAGKALPRDAAKRLNDEVRALREAERAALDADDASRPAALRGFETARNAIASVLFDVFGDRFDDRALRAMVPGQRRAPPVPAAP